MFHLYSSAVKPFCSEMFSYFFWISTFLTCFISAVNEVGFLLGGSTPPGLISLNVMLLKGGMRPAAGINVIIIVHANNMHVSAHVMMVIRKCELLL